MSIDYGAPLDWADMQERNAHMQNTKPGTPVMVLTPNAGNRMTYFGYVNGPNGEEVAFDFITERNGKICTDSNSPYWDFEYYQEEEA